MHRYCIAVLFFSPQVFQAQQTCPSGLRVEGVVTDLSGALIPGANVTANGLSVTSDATGQFVLTCVPVSSAVGAVATGFSTATVLVDGSAGSTVHVSMRLSVGDVQSSVQVNADAPTLDDVNAAGTVLLSKAEIDQLPDDPDDLIAQLQSMAANGGVILRPHTHRCRWLSKWQCDAPEECYRFDLDQSRCFRSRV